MDIKKEIQQIKRERAELYNEHQRNEEEKKEKIRFAASRYDPLARRVLDEFGKSLWGEGTYAIGQSSANSASWIIIHEDKNTSLSDYQFIYYKIKLNFDSSYNPACFGCNYRKFIHGDSSDYPYASEAKTCELSENGLREMLVEMYKNASIEHANPANARYISKDFVNFSIPLFQNGNAKRQSKSWWKLF